MAAFVKSVEEITVDLADGTGLETVTTNLTNGQDFTQCVPFFTTRYAAGTGTGNRPTNSMISIELFDNAGTAAIRVRRNRHTSSNNGQITLEVYVLEFASSVTVQQGSSVLTESDNTVTATISSVVQDNSFIVTSHHRSSATIKSDFGGNGYLRSEFNSNTQIEINRQSISNQRMQCDVYWYVVEGNGIDFQTEYFEYTFGTTEQGPSNITLSNTVVLDNSFIAPCYSVQGFTTESRDFGINHALTGTSTVTWYRNGGSNLEKGGVSAGWVIRSNAAGLSTQRLATDVKSTTTTNETITSVDLSKAAIMDGGNTGTNSQMVVTNSTPGTTALYNTHTVGLSSATNVEIRRRSNTLTGSNNIARYEVVEFELAAAGPPQTIPVGLVSETDTVQTVTPVAGAVSVAVGVVSEADTVFDVSPIPGAVSVEVNSVSEGNSVFVVTPEIGGAPQTVPVGLASEVDSVLEVTPFAGEVTLPVALVTETDTVFGVDPVITKAPQTISVGLVAETDDVLSVTILPGGVTLPVGEVTELDQVAPVFPVLEGGPQTVLVINISEVDTVFPVTPRVPTIGSRNQEEDFFIGIRIGI